MLGEDVAASSLLSVGKTPETVSLQGRGMSASLKLSAAELNCYLSDGPGDKAIKQIKQNPDHTNAILHVTC